MKISTLSERLEGLIVFRNLLEEPVCAKFKNMLLMAELLSGDLHGVNVKKVISTIAEFEEALFEKNTNWSKYLYSLVLENESACIRAFARGKASPIIEACLFMELLVLEQVSRLSFADFLGQATGKNAKKLSFLPAWETSKIDFTKGYLERMAEVEQKGYGIFAQHHVFVVEQGVVVPVKYPDTQCLANLPGYEQEREKIIANTKALLNGQATNNVLLYGDAGTGKSSAVKAIANDYAQKGLRLVEIKKNQLYQLPEIMETLADNPLKFIVFIDDLSFSANDDNFSALKAILEGSVCGRTSNVAIYATSNRRHLVKESMSERAKDDVHAADTRQELMSLSARFGLTVTFLKPEKDRYLNIIKALAKQYDVNEDELLLQRAEAFALRAGGRSPRVAKQFIELCKGGILN